jgi:hypothetical protein
MVGRRLEERPTGVAVTSLLSFGLPRFVCVK